ncbi:MAG: hypothetical protein REI64_15750 [Pedobacter sp.]|uniref:hypothetical protein n=1 Tax=Pedobacter sp. TaxID=1411316 RepID=UPI002806B29C|nr:hypothetical protein [Pedobacter sp.]MDQ8006255.1 hypothetical protein [Pedobacter sp.]
MMSLKKIFSVLLLLAYLQVSAQKEAPAAFNGYKANYIYNIFKPASAAHPDGQVVGFRLDRKATQETAWQTLYKFSTPATFEELQNNYQKALNNVFEFNAVTAYTAAEVWPIFKKKFNFDSLGVHLTQQHLASAFNILLVDSTARKDVVYQYRVIQIKADGTENGKYTSLPVSSNDKFIANRPKKSGRKISGDIFRMEWRAKLNGELPEVLLINRSEGLNMPFKRLLNSYSIEQKGDTVIYTLEDGNVTKETLYQYTITPVNRFGGGANAVSDTLQMVLVDEKMLIPKIFTATADTINNAMALNWSFIKPDFVSVVNIFRSTEYEDGYKLIKSTTGYSYVDRDIVAGQKYYYYLTVNDKMGRTTERSVKIYGLSQKNTKSQKPTHVSVSKSKEGNVISWMDNATDSRGFYVYRTNEVAGALKPITEMIYVNPNAKNSYSYIDTASNLQGKIGYAILAENLSNVRSNFSAIEYVENIIKTTSQPTLIDINKVNDGVFVFWRDETAAMVASGYNIYRKVGKETYVKVNKTAVLPIKTSYKDVFPINDMAVSYKITSVNSSGEESNFSNELSINQFEMVYPPVSVKSFYSADLKSVILQWQAPQSSVANYEVYRYVRGAEPVKIATLEAKELSYTDTGFDKTKNNYYFIKTVGLNGNVSLPSSETFKVVVDK